MEGDRPGVVQERVGVHDLGREPPLVRDVVHRVAVDVDVERVERIVAEVVEVGSAVGRFEWDPVRQQCDLVRIVGPDECIRIGIVDHRVFGDQRCFPVAGARSAN